jgi:uncharacterized protein YbbC (DUF1343 family)
VRYLIFVSLFFSINIYCEVLTGLDVLIENNFSEIRNKRVGVIVNHTSVDRNGNKLVDLFIKNGINLVAIFSPEHGFFGDIEGGYYIENSTYNTIPIYSLYGKTKRPTDEMLKNIDILVFDIQDVGARFYTYLTTMGYSMEEAAKRNIEFIVLDRPNPVGDIIEGAVLRDDISAFTAYFKVPTRHSLTAGEMAIFHKIKMNLDLKLKIIKMKNYKRGMFYNETGLKWINPSPNIRNINAAVLYSGIGCFETTNISVGRGTDMPFEFFGAPWMDNIKISDEMNKKKLKGVRFSPCEKIPSLDLYAGERVKGVCIDVYDKKKVRAFDIFVNAIYLINKYHSDKLIIKEDDISKMVGDKDFYYILKSGKEPSYIIKKYKKELKDFKKFIKSKGIVIY